MPIWLIIILVVAVIGVVLGFIGNEKGKRGIGAAQGTLGGSNGMR